MKREHINWILDVACGVLLGVTAFLGYRTYNLKQELTSATRTTQTTKKNKPVTKKSAPKVTTTTIKDYDRKDNTWLKYSQDDEVVHKFFQTMFAYDSANFMSRFDVAKKYADQQAINLIIGTGGKPEQPKSSIESKLTEFNFYPEVRPNDDQVSTESYRALVSVATIFTYQGVVSETHQDYAIDYSRAQKKIIHLYARNEEGDMD